MKILLTENAPIGMLHLGSVEYVITDFFPVGIYHDELYEIKDFIKLCNRTDYPMATMICNKSPWTDMIWSDPMLGYGQSPRQSDLYEIKRHIYTMAGWKPDAVINIYNVKPSDDWRQKLNVLSEADPELTIIGLNAADPNFSRNIIETLKMLEAGAGH